VRATCLAAHALPPEFDARADDYIDAVCGWLAQLHAESLVDAVDAYCERIAFTREQVARVFAAGATAGVAGEAACRTVQRFRRRGARCGLPRAVVRPPGVPRRRRRGQRWPHPAARPCCCRGRFYFLRETRLPPVDALRRAGVPIAIASDHNPGTSPMLSLRLMLNMACTLFGLTPEEALRGVTVHAARALGLDDRGRLSEGLQADFAVWDLEHPAELAYWVGGNPCCGWSAAARRGCHERRRSDLPPASR